MGLRRTREAIKLKTLSDDYVRAVQALDHGTAGPISQAVDGAIWAGSRGAGAR